MGRVISTCIQFIDAFSNPSKETIKSMRKMATEAKAAGKSIEGTGKTISNVGSTLTKSITMPIAGVAAAAVKTATDFESAMTEVKVIAGATAEEFDKLKQEAKNLGATTKFSAIESAEAMQYMAQAGWDTQSILEGTEGVMNAAAASGESLANVANIVAKNITAFGDSAGQATMYADVMSAAAAVSAADINYLGEGFKYCASTAGSMGYSVQDMSIALAAMSQAGIEAGTAGATLRNIISNMAKPSKQQAAVMDKLGLSLTDSKGKTKDFATVMNDLRKSFSGLSESEKAAAASGLAGKESMAGLLSIVGTSDKDFKTFTDAINNSTGTAKDMAAEMQNNLSGQITLLKSGLEGIAITIGDKLLPYIKNAVAWLQKATEWFNGLSDAQVSQIMKWAGIAAAVGPCIMIFGKIVSVVGVVVTKFGAISAAITKAGSVMALITSPAGIVIGVIAALIAVGVLLYKNWDKVKAAAKTVFTYVKNVFKDLGITGASLKEKFAPLGEQFARIGVKVKELWVVAKPTVMKIAEVFTSVFKVRFGAVIGAAVGLLSSGINFIKEFAGGIMTAFEGVIDFLTGVFTGNWAQAWEGVKSIFKGIFESLAAVAKAPINAVIGLINGAIAGINRVGVTIPDWVPGVGGKEFKINIPQIPTLATGTDNWKGGIVQISERGGEIVDLPKGSRVYPHDESVNMARKSADNQLAAANRKLATLEKGGKASKGDINITIPKLADQIIVKDKQDIDEIAEQIATKLKNTALNMGVC